MLWAIQGWKNTGKALNLELDTTMLWSRIFVVVASAATDGPFRCFGKPWSIPVPPSARRYRSACWRRLIGSWLGSGQSGCWLIALFRTLTY